MLRTLENIKSWLKNNQLFSWLGQKFLEDESHYFQYFKPIKRPSKWKGATALGSCSCKLMGRTSKIALRQRGRDVFECILETSPKAQQYTKQLICCCAADKNLIKVYWMTATYSTVKLVFILTTESCPIYGGLSMHDKHEYFWIGRAETAKNQDWTWER